MDYKALSTLLDSATMGPCHRRQGSEMHHCHTGTLLALQCCGNHAVQGGITLCPKGDTQKSFISYVRPCQWMPGQRYLNALKARTKEQSEITHCSQSWPYLGEGRRHGQRRGSEDERCVWPILLENAEHVENFDLEAANSKYPVDYSESRTRCRSGDVSLRSAGRYSTLAEGSSEGHQGFCSNEQTLESLFSHH